MQNVLYGSHNEVLKKIIKKVAQNQKERVDISMINNEERKFGKYDIHRTY